MSGLYYECTRVEVRSDEVRVGRLVGAVAVGVGDE